MSLGTTLEDDIKAAISPSDTSINFTEGMKTAITNYLSDAEYGEGAILWPTGEVAVTDFDLASSTSAAQAAAIIAQGVMSWWGDTGTATGVAGEPTQETSVVGGTITATGVLPALTASLTATFNDLSSGQYLIKAVTENLATLPSETKDILNNKPHYVVELTGAPNTYHKLVEGSWVEVTDTKWAQIASDIESAVTENVVVAWTEITPPATANPYSGGIS